MAKTQPRIVDDYYAYSRIMTKQNLKDQASLVQGLLSARIKEEKESHETPSKSQETRRNKEKSSKQGYSKEIS